MRWLGVSEVGLTQPTPILDVGISRNGRFAVTSDPRCVFRVFDLEREQCVADAKVPAQWKATFDSLRKVSVSDDGRRVVGQLDGCVVSGDVTAWDPAVRPSTTFFGRARALSPAPVRFGAQPSASPASRLSSSSSQRAIRRSSSACAPWWLATARSIVSPVEV